MSAVMTGHAHQRLPAHRRTRLGDAGIALAHMDAVASKRRRQRRIIVQDHRRAGCARRLDQRRGEAANLVGGVVLQADLHGGDIASRQGRSENRLEIRLDARRGKDVKLGHGVRSNAMRARKEARIAAATPLAFPSPDSMS